IMVTITVHCPYCQSDALVRNGRAPNGKQKYLCRACKNSYEPLPHISSHRVAHFTLMLLSLRKATANLMNQFPCSPVYIVERRACSPLWRQEGRWLPTKSCFGNGKVAKQTRSPRWSSTIMPRWWRTSITCRVMPTWLNTLHRTPFSG